MKDLTDLIITSRQNSLVKYIRSLRDKKTREQEKLFVAEGINFVNEAILSGAFPEKLVISQRAAGNPRLAAMLGRIADPAVITRVDDSVMEYMSETDSPQGVMALLRIPVISLDSLVNRADSMLVIIDGVQDPGNVGTIIRNADAFGAAGVILTKGCADLYNAKTLRSTMGSVFHLPVARDVAAAELVGFLGRNSVYTAVTCLQEDAPAIEDSRLRFPLALVFGSEARGVSQELVHAADLSIKVPMAGAAESLNVAVAAGIVVYEAYKRLHSNAK